MISAEQARDRCAQLIDIAMKEGAEAADAVASFGSSESVSVRLGKLEDVERSEGEEIGLRVFIGARSATINTSEFSQEGLRELAQRAVAMAALAPEDVFAGLADQNLLAAGDFPALDLLCEEEPEPALLKEWAMEAEDAARAIKGVSNSEGAGASFGRGVSALVTSHGFAAAYEGTSFGLSASVIAGEGADMQRDYAYRTARHREDLPPAIEIGARAGTRAVERLNPAEMASGPMPVVFDPRVSATLIGHLLGAMNGAGIARGSSFLLGRLEEELFPENIQISEDPHIARGPSSRPFDGEGLPTRARDLVQGGRVSGWLLNSAAARQLELTPTGHAVRSGSGAPGISASNVWCHAGAVSRDALIADIDQGVLITELIGQGVNGVTGDYSRGASGVRIENGAIAGPVSDFTIAGNLIEMFAHMRAADDLEMHRGVNAPSLRVEGMNVAG